MSTVQRDRARAVVDLVFALQGSRVPADYRFELLGAIEERLPWLRQEPGAGIVGISVTPTGTETALLARRARLTLRVPAGRLQEAIGLQGSAILLGTEEVVIGAAAERPLRPSDTLYADMVVLDVVEEVAFDRALGDLIRSEALECRWILGRRRSVGRPGGVLQGFAVALHGLGPEPSLLLQEQGLGAERTLGCGIFVPHKRIEGAG